MFPTDHHPLQALPLRLDPSCEALDSSTQCFGIVSKNSSQGKGLKRNHKESPWLPQQDTILADLVKKFGSNHTLIAERFSATTGRPRTVDDVRRRILQMDENDREMKKICTKKIVKRNKRTRFYDGTALNGFSSFTEPYRNGAQEVQALKQNPKKRKASDAISPPSGEPAGSLKVPLPEVAAGLLESLDDTELQPLNVSADTLTEPCLNLSQDPLTFVYKPWLESNVPV